MQFTDYSCLRSSADLARLVCGFVARLPARTDLAMNSLSHNNCKTAGVVPTAKRAVLMRTIAGRQRDIMPAACMTSTAGSPALDATEHHHHFLQAL